MPIPRVVTKANRRVLNHVMRPLAAWLPPLALLRHTGRRTGTAYVTPVMAFPAGDGFVIALTYGPGTDWQRNLEKAGGGELVYRRATWRLGPPRLVHAAPHLQPLPWPVPFVLRLIRVDDFLHISATRVTPQEGRRDGIRRGRSPSPHGAEFHR